MKIISLALTFVVLLFCCASFAQEAATVKAEDKYSYLTALNYIDEVIRPLKQTLKENKIDLNFFAGVLQGFDNNVNLDPDRKKDGFLDASLNTEVAYNYTDDIRLKVENYTTSVLYYNVNSANMFDFYNRAGLELDIFEDRVMVGADYVLDYVLFPNDKNGTYLGNEAKVFIKHKLTPDFYHKLGYKFLHKGYADDRTRGSNMEKTETTRTDDRNEIDYEVGLYLFNRLILRTSIEFYKNDSNYQYMDYYDYWSFKVRPSLMYSITKNLYTSASFSYQQRRYDDRLSSNNDEHVQDNTYVFNTSILYDLSKSFTVAINYSYRENVSNDSLQKYSGSIVTGGLYYSF